MKKIILLVASLFSLTFVKAKKVQFTVDMTGQTLNAGGVWIWGDFQVAAGFPLNWDATTCHLLKDVVDTNLYHITVDIPAFQAYTFKYMNGGSYAVEVVPVESQVGYNFNDNRWIFIDSLSTDTFKLAPIVFNQNAPKGEKAIRYRVDMTTHTIVNGFATVISNEIGVSNPSYRLYSFANNVYELIGYSYDPALQFRYADGYFTPEIVPSSCADSVGARTATMTTDTVLDIVCFSKCSSCYPAAVSNTLSESTTTILSPNPMFSSSFLKFNDHANSHEIAILDITGKSIQQYSTNSSTFLLEKNNLQTGIYFIQIKNELNQHSTIKLFVE